MFLFNWQNLGILINSNSGYQDMNQLLDNSLKTSYFKAILQNHVN